MPSAGGAVLSGRRPFSIAKSDCISALKPQNFLRACGAAKLPPHYNTTARPMRSTITISCGSGQAARQS